MNKDQLFSASNGTFTSYYNYDIEGNRTRKVVVKGNIVETRYYIGGYEVYRKYTNSILNFERKMARKGTKKQVCICMECGTMRRGCVGL